MAAATLDEDFGADPVPDDNRIAWPLVFFAEMGVATALFFMQVTSILATTFGSAVTLTAILYASIAAGLVGLGICRISIRTGFGMSLLARRVLGFRGASLFSLIFGVNAFVYFAAEATIMGSSIKQLFPGVPLRVVLPLLSLAMIPLIWFGMRLLARLQLATFVLYAVLLLAAVAISLHAPAGGRDWLHYVPAHAPGFWPGLIAAFGTMNSVLFTTGLLIADYARFARRSDMKIASVFVGVGFPVFCFAFSGLLGLWFSVRYQDSNPGTYFVVMLAGWGTLFAIATQLRINLANMYSGSMAVLNILRQVADIVVSRHLMVLLFGVAVAGSLLFDWLSHLTKTLNVIGMFTTCFTCLVLIDVYVLRPIAHSEDGHVEAGHAALPDWRWTAVVPLVTATAAGSVLQTGLFGQALASLASLLAAAAQCLLQITLDRIANRTERGRTWQSRSGAVS